MEALNRARATQLGFRAYNGTLVSPSTVAVDSDTVPAGQHWLVTGLTAWFASNTLPGAGPLTIPFSGIFLCPNGTPKVPTTDENPANMVAGNVVAPSSASLLARPIQLVAGQIGNSNQGGTFGKVPGLVGAFLAFPDVLDVPSLWFLRATFCINNLGAAFGAGDIVRLSFAYIQEPNCS